MVVLATPERAATSSMLSWATPRSATNSAVAASTRRRASSLRGRPTPAPRRGDPTDRPGDADDRGHCRKRPFVVLHDSLRYRSAIGHRRPPTPPVRPPGAARPVDEHSKSTRERRMTHESMNISGPVGGVGTFTQDELDGIPPHVYARRWKTLAVLCASLVIVIVGNTVLNVALPTLQKASTDGGLDATNTQIQWIVDAYGLVFAGLLFTAGALGDRFGRKGALQAGLLVFGLGSLVGALSDSSGMLIFARAVMGAGAAFVMPSTLSLLTNVFPSRERAKAIAIWAGISGGGAAIGPVASGFLLEHFWWGSVFLVNLPIIAAALIAGWILVP